MRYVIALFCPPLAMVWSGKPAQAILATLALIVATFTWTSGLGIVLVALTMLWSCRVAGDRYAAEELEGFLQLCRTTKVR